MTILDYLLQLRQVIGPFPLLVLAALVALGAVEYWKRVKKEARRERAITGITENTLAEIRNMSQAEFVRYVEWLYLALGYEVDTDIDSLYGADLIVWQDDIYTAVRVKKMTNRVKTNAVKDAYTSKGYWAEKTGRRYWRAAVITNSYFEPETSQMGKTLNVTLLDKEWLKGTIDSFSRDYVERYGD